MVNTPLQISFIPFVIGNEIKNRRMVSGDMSTAKAKVQKRKKNAASNLGQQ